jgi:hypothetical protein
VFAAVVTAAGGFKGKEIVDMVTAKIQTAVNSVGGR